MKIRFRFDGKCPTHPRYNPKIDGAGGIKGGCKTCDVLFRIWGQMEHTKNLVGVFTNNAVATKQFIERRANNESRNDQAV